MAALSVTTPARTGTVTAGAAVAASDTIASAITGTRGCLLEIANASGSTDNITISDAGSSPAGTPVTSYAVTVSTGTAKIFKIVPAQRSATTGLVTVTHSETSSVTYKLYPLD